MLQFQGEVKEIESDLEKAEKTHNDEAARIQKDFEYWDPNGFSTLFDEQQARDATDIEKKLDSLNFKERANCDKFMDELHQGEYELDSLKEQAHVNGLFEVVDSINQLLARIVIPISDFGFPSHHFVHQGIPPSSPNNRSASHRDQWFLVFYKLLIKLFS